MASIYFFLSLLTGWSSVWRLVLNNTSAAIPACLRMRARCLSSIVRVPITAYGVHIFLRERSIYLPTYLVGWLAGTVQTQQKCTVSSDQMCEVSFSRTCCCFDSVKERGKNCVLPPALYVRSVSYVDFVCFLVMGLAILHGVKLLLVYHIARYTFVLFCMHVY